MFNDAADVDNVVTDDLGVSDARASVATWPTLTYVGFNMDITIIRFHVRPAM